MAANDGGDTPHVPTIRRAKRSSSISTVVRRRMTSTAAFLAGAGGAMSPVSGTRRPFVVPMADVEQPSSVADELYVRSTTAHSDAESDDESVSVANPIWHVEPAIASTSMDVTENGQISDNDAIGRASGGGSSVGKLTRGESEKLADCASHGSEVSFKELHLFGPGGSRFIGRGSVRNILPDEKATVFVGTWNLAGKAGRSATSLRRWLHGSSTASHLVDIYALCLQEVPSIDMCFHQSMVTTIGEILGTNFATFFWVRKWAQMLLVFVRTELLPLTSDPQWKFVPSDVLAKPAKTKGAIAVVFRVCHITLLFVGCHLSYGPQAERIKDYHKIKKMLCFSELQRRRFAKGSAVDEIDQVFWFGDMNFKVTDSSAMERLLANTLTGQHAVSISAASGVNSLLLADQLRTEMNNGTIFEKFTEPEIVFRPTYKFNIGTSEYNSKRIPSYTDRILHRSNDIRRGIDATEESAIECQFYNSIHDECTSDHKPVVGVFRVRVIPVEKSQPGRKRSSSVPQVFE